MKYGHRIAKLRNDQRLTQEDLAGKVGITRSALSHYENNRREPDYETIQKFADFFQVTIDFLMGRSDDSSHPIDNDVQEFISHLELSDEALMERFVLTIDGRELTPEESRRFIAFIRYERTSK
ncbi:helix-turn-helix domain-containing protein [Paenibacillus sp. NPDC056579]|uniref:helix-turn-helix domain-containing protein n=1 Tax=unclassified Paenibacillus TaxID=185978 RepID=UPI001EF753D1|nr:helix-turn-helix transcriptional regulator [Paenibacillus sp. H1-7]ULL13998.1 XRE family transcriptional regulator [Paenibacillus sp. H1-7]